MVEKKILVVDDEDYIRELMQKLLGRLGYRVSVAESSEKAIGMIKHEKFPVIITDLLMMGMDGVEFCELVRRSHRKVKIFALSGHGALFDPDKIEKAGFDGFIEKPIDMATIQKTIAGCFKKRK